jgi:hypothetical protein
MPEHLRLPVIAMPHGAEAPPQVTGTDEDVPARTLLAGARAAGPRRSYEGASGGPLMGIPFSQGRWQKPGGYSLEVRVAEERAVEARGKSPSTSMSTTPIALACEPRHTETRPFCHPMAP